MKTVDLYKNVFEIYVRTIGSERALTLEGVQEFLDYEIKQGKSNNTLRLHYFALKNALGTLGVDISEIPSPDIDEAEVKRPRFSKEEIAALIQSAKELGKVCVKAMVFSSVYGMRRLEIARHRRNDIDFKDKTLLVRTAKKGKTRKHLIPDELVKYLPDMSMPTIETLSRSTFPKIAEKAKVDYKQRSWHAIRRALVSDLKKNGCHNDKIITFLRWKTGSMLDTYHLISPEEDLPVFEVHPYLDIWRKD